MKKNGKLEPVSWNEALKVVADKLQPLASQRDGIAAIASTRLPAETLTAFKDLFAGNQLVTSLEEGMPRQAFRNLHRSRAPRRETM
jgi:NADH dehydrogenase/NADH:ubiquinone oxidoreductase subunit G